MVVTVYSYAPGGAAQWYLASGPLSGSVFSATLDNYTGGQCIGCDYTGRPTLHGNDGIITAAPVLLPNGRVTRIDPQSFYGRRCPRSVVVQNAHRLPANSRAPQVLTGAYEVTWKFSTPS